MCCVGEIAMRVFGSVGRGGFVGGSQLLQVGELPWFGIPCAGANAALANILIAVFNMIPSYGTVKTRLSAILIPP
jgi:hypothetical protein